MLRNSGCLGEPLALARHECRERPPQQPREEEPPVFGPSGPQGDRRASPARGWNRPSSHSMSAVWPPSCPCKWPPSVGLPEEQGVSGMVRHQLHLIEIGHQLHLFEIMLVEWPQLHLYRIGRWNLPRLEWAEPT